MLNSKCNHHILSMTEFTANDTDSVITDISLFFVNKDFDFTISFFYDHSIIDVNSH